VDFRPARQGAGDWPVCGGAEIRRGRAQGRDTQRRELPGAWSACGLGARGVGEGPDVETGASLARFLRL
jgi:hypothetical protein